MQGGGSLVVVGVDLLGGELGGRVRLSPTLQCSSGHRGSMNSLTNPGGLAQCLRQAYDSSVIGHRDLVPMSGVRRVVRWKVKWLEMPGASPLHTGSPREGMVDVPHPRVAALS